MLIVMHKDATPRQVARVCETIKAMGFTPHTIPGAQRVAIGITGNKGAVDTGRLESMAGVLNVIPVTQPYKLASRETKPEDTVVDVNGVKIGGGSITIIAGPCAVENARQAMTIARSVKRSGATVMRGGAFKPRTSPYAFQGLGEAGLKILKKIRKATGLPVISEALDTDNFHLVEKYVDIIQIGARNMQNYSLLKKAGRSAKPVMLKRGISSTIHEFLFAAEYIVAEGNYQVILCERGIRTFSDHTRYTLDISSIPELKRITHLPVVVDPSHAAGKRDIVVPLAKAAIAAGADGVMVEVHDRPEEALSDGPQSLTLGMFRDMVRELKAIVRAAPSRGRKTRS
jgi:3-deoxy-7-phosphoheptulonate synthase